MVTPGTRLRDDLYVLYLVALSWFVLPVYGRALALLFPSHSPMFGRWLDVALAAASLGALWWGMEGGPLVVSRAAVVHELGSPTSRFRVLAPRLTRQALTGATFSGVGGAMLLAMNGGAHQEEMAEATVVSVVCGLVAAATVLQAVGWFVAFRAHSGPRAILGGINAACSVAVLGFVSTGASLRTGEGVALLAGVCAVAAVVAMLSLRWVPVDRLWRRAGALESMRSAMQTFDFQRALLDLRRANDRQDPATLRLAQPWMPLPLWRQLSSMQHQAARHLLRVVALGGSMAAIVALADVREGLVILALAACSGMLGFEFSTGLAATADQGIFVVHYRRGSGSVLRGQLLVSLGFTLLVAVVLVSWRFIHAPAEALLVILLCGYGALGAGLQARLGSPNLGEFVDKVGFSMVGPLLWGRAMLGPVVLLAGALVLEHRLFHHDFIEDAEWSFVAAAVAVVAAVVVTSPIEKKPPQEPA